MYDTQKIALRIKQRSREIKAPLKEVLADCGLGINTVSNLATGREISYLSFAALADRLDCSVDWLLGRTDRPEVNR